ncbi:hypothetical protein [Catenulispora subtropica]|uniref:Uncharacterized protein n=1 Tax=Catenulispora subtropica TaxID=450798 RepID=A0ABP5E7J9_9ACTN
MTDVTRPPRSTTPMAPSERLSAALAEADRAFGPRTDSIGPVDGCTHCFDAEHLRTIGGPVDDIPEWLFSRALGKWGTTMDADSRLWRRLTPRILREMTRGTLHKDESLMARKFNEAGWRDWPPRETAALEDVCHAWWHAALAGMSQGSAVTVLGFVVPLTGGVQPWLDRWDTHQDRAAALQLRDLWQSWMPELLDGRLDVSFGGEGPDIAASVSTWLLQQSPERLDLGGFNAQDRYGLHLLALTEAQRNTDPGSSEATTTVRP